MPKGTVTVTARLYENFRGTIRASVRLDLHGCSVPFSLSQEDFNALDGVMETSFHRNRRSVVFLLTEPSRDNVPPVTGRVAALLDVELEDPPTIELRDAEAHLSQPPAYGC